MRLILLGPPGAGKGTQAERLCADHELLHLSTGALLRQAVAEGNDLGKKAKSYMDAGALVPDLLVADIVTLNLHGLGNDEGFLLDGFPRNTDQAAILESEPVGRTIDLVVYIRIPAEQVIERLVARGRSDDTREVIRNRIEVYDRQTSPLIHYYETKGLLATVDGTGTRDEVAENIQAALRERHLLAGGAGANA